MDPWLGNKMVQVSVILSTYNSPDWLAKVLWGYSAQSYPHFEILVADDGSTPATAALIARMQHDTGLMLRHVWQEDQGFRKCRILNRAILAARGEYLIFSDGDCIPRKDFVAQHVRFAKPNQFLSGGIVRLPMDLSVRISREDILNGSIFRPTSLLALGMPWTRKLRFLVTKPWLAWTFERFSLTRATFNGYNSSAWKVDVESVNGFDERLYYGGLDRELGERLTNASIRPQSLRHQTTCLHLDHSRGYSDPELIAANQRIRCETRRKRCTWTSFGLNHDSLKPPEYILDRGSWQSVDEETIIPFSSDAVRNSSTRSPLNRHAA
ncbi:MAG TPA: glycosyltransferase family 2 protein [Pirellulales bacterium]|nr:glycosyltransferase family 2 protein [Pirellulales bacterium]